MSSLSYYNEPAPLAWDVAAAIFGATDTVGSLYDPSSLDTLFQDATGTTPAVPGSPVGLVLDKSGNSRNLSQPTTAARPILARMPLTGRRNLLPSTEPASSAAWVKQDVTLTANAAIAPDGSMTATRFSTTNRMYIMPNAGTTYSEPITLTFYAKADEGSSFTLGTASISPSGAMTANLLAGSITGNSAGTITTVGDGWFKIVYKAILSNSTGYFQFYNAPSSILLWGFQWELGTASTPFQRVTNAYDITEEGVPDTYSLVYDLADDALTTTLPQAINGDLLIAGTKGSVIEPVSYAAGSTFTLGPDTYTGGTPGILRAIGDIVGVVLIDRELTQNERDNLILYYKGKGAKGLLVPGLEIVHNLSEWTSFGSGSAAVSGDEVTVTSSGTFSGIEYDLSSSTTLGGVYLVKASITDGTGRVTVEDFNNNPATPNTNMTAPSELKVVLICRSESIVSLRFRTAAAASTTTWDGISVKELRAQEDWT